MDRRERETDRKNKHHGRPEGYQDSDGLWEDKQFTGEVCGVWDT